MRVWVFEKNLGRDAGIGVGLREEARRKQG
jgi:hypothetical protein